MPKQRTEHEQQSRRRLRQGILWSLAVHVLVLGMGFNLLRWPDGAGTALTDSRLNARLHGQVAALAPPTRRADQQATFAGQRVNASGKRRPASPEKGISFGHTNFFSRGRRGAKAIRCNDAFQHECRARYNKVRYSGARYGRA